MKHIRKVIRATTKIVKNLLFQCQNIEMFALLVHLQIYLHAVHELHAAFVHTDDMFLRCNFVLSCHTCLFILKNVCQLWLVKSRQIFIKFDLLLFISVHTYIKKHCIYLNVIFLALRQQECSMTLYYG